MNDERNNNVTINNSKEKKNNNNIIGKSEADHNNNNIIYNCHPINLKRCVAYLDTTRLKQCAIFTHWVKRCHVSVSLCAFSVCVFLP